MLTALKYIAPIPLKSLIDLQFKSLKKNIKMENLHTCTCMSKIDKEGQ